MSRTVRLYYLTDQGVSLVFPELPTVELAVGKWERVVTSHFLINTIDYICGLNTALLHAFSCRPHKVNFLFLVRVRVNFL